MDKINIPRSTIVRVVGVGGGGCNAITRMAREQIHGVELIAINTDSQHLAFTEAKIRLQIGTHTTHGLGAGGDHEKGKIAAEESRDEIKRVLTGSDMIFITAGMGGGTGTGAAPVIAEISSQCGALTVGIVTKPFNFEGVHRMMVAEQGIVELGRKLDTLMVIPNDQLLDVCDANTDVRNAFNTADLALHEGVKAIAELITVPGLVNLDFADIRVLLHKAGPAWISTGTGSGRNRAKDAANMALAKLPAEKPIRLANKALFNLSGDDLTFFELNEAAKIINDALAPEANVTFGVIVDPKMGGELRLTLIATGFPGSENIIPKSLKFK
jgi:cell division protein FtsZ